MQADFFESKANLFYQPNKQKDTACNSIDCKLFGWGYNINKMAPDMPDLEESAIETNFERHCSPFLK